MSYQIKFIEDCVVIISLLFFISAAHFYQEEKIDGKKLDFKEVMTHTYSKLLHNASDFFLTTGHSLASLQETKPVNRPKNKTQTFTKISATSPKYSHKKEIQALNKQINFIKEIIITDTILELSEKNILQELIKECETKLDHLSHFIKKSLIENTPSNQINNEESIKMFESYVTKKIIALSENVLQLTLRFYKITTGKEYVAPECSSNADILLVLYDLNKKIKSFII